MKNALFALIYFFIITGVASADEMVVHLKSGSSLTIEYTGSIENISMQGSSDAIEGMAMRSSESAQPSHNELKTSEIPAHEAVRETQETKSPHKIFFKWAKPQTED